VIEICRENGDRFSRIFKLQKGGEIKMKGRKPLIRVLLFSIALIFLFVVNCAAEVSQEEYDKLVDELVSAQTQIETLKSDLEAAQDKIDSLQLKMKQAKAQAEIISGLFVPALTGELKELSEGESINFFLGWWGKVEASEDAVLKEKFQALIDSKEPRSKLRGIKDKNLKV
jgi:hypothetical protein